MSDAHVTLALNIGGLILAALLFRDCYLAGLDDTLERELARRPRDAELRFNASAKHAMSSLLFVIALFLVSMCTLNIIFLFI